MITSTKNSKIKEIAALQAKKKNRISTSTFVVEGVRILEEALDSGLSPLLTLHTEDLQERGIALVQRSHELGAPVEAVMPHVMSAASDTKNPQGILMVFPFPKLQGLESLNSVLIVDQIRDPGNMGTLLRSAAAAAFNSVWLTPDCVDVFSPKVVRSGMGAHFKIPIVNLQYEDIASNIIQHQLQLFISEMDASINYSEANFRAPSAIVVGSEATGTSEELLSLPHTKINIPMPGQVESLNASVAGSLLMFEVVRQRSKTTRLATVPFPLLFKGLSHTEVIKAAQEFEKLAAQAGFAYTSLGPALLSHPKSYSLIPEIIQSTENIFLCAEMATRENGLSLPAVRACAEVIHALAPQDPNGFANLYFTALSNVSAGSPFFPASYHGGGEPCFAFATEAASLAVDAFNQSSTINEGVDKLVTAITHHSEKLISAGNKTEKETGAKFSGIDFSLAPFPDEAYSIGTAIENMGVPEVGLHGSLAAAAILADALDRVDHKHVGFSGLLFAQLEDSSLAHRAAEGSLTVKDLLMYSTVCGTGLDTIPLPGDISPDELVPLLLDLSALALRLNKPLTARLMPIPNKKAGDLTSFDFSFFANSRVMPLSSKPLQGNLTKDDNLTISPRNNPES